MPIPSALTTRACAAHEVIHGARDKHIEGDALALRYHHSTVGEVLVDVVRNVSTTAAALLESHPQRMRRAVLLAGEILALEEGAEGSGR